MPGMEVEGIGPIALPLLPFQAQALAKVTSRRLPLFSILTLLVKLCTQAPFGMGTNTVVNTAVRNTWQLDAGAVSPVASLPLPSSSSPSSFFFLLLFLFLPLPA